MVVDSLFSDDVEYEEFPEDDLHESEGEATSDSQFVVHHSFPLEGDRFGSRNRVDGTERNVQVDLNVPIYRPDDSSPASAWVDVACSNTDFQIRLLKGQLSHVNVLGGSFYIFFLLNIY